MKATFVSLLLVLAAPFGLAQDLAFIAHPGITEASVSATDVKNILLGTKVNWSNGPIRVVIQAGGPLHEKVIQQFTQRSPDQFDKYWKKQVFTGKGTMPAVAKSDAEVVEFVASTTGAFGYVLRDAVTDKIKVLELK